MIDFIERLREEHNRKKGLDSFQPGGTKDEEGGGNMFSNAWNKAGTFLDSLRYKDFEETQSQKVDNTLNTGVGSQRPTSSNPDGTFAGSNIPTGSIEFNPTKLGQGASTTLKDLNIATATGEKTIGQQAAADYTSKNTGTIYKTESLAENTKATQGATPTQNITQPKRGGVEDFFKFFTPGDLQSNLYAAGRAAGFKPSNGKQAMAKGVSVAGYGLAAGLGAAREFLGGYGNSVAANYVNNYNLDQETQRRYSNDSQTMNTNNRGGFSAKDGGRISFFQEGGEAPEQMEGQEPEATQQEVPQKILDIASQLVENFDSLENIDKYLRQNKIDEQSYNMIMEAAQDILEAENEDETTDEEGTEDVKEGDYVEFEHGGKLHKGRVSKIVNGKIYL